MSVTWVDTLDEAIAGAAESGRLALVDFFSPY